MMAAILALAVLGAWFFSGSRTTPPPATPTTPPTTAAAVPPRPSGPCVGGSGFETAARLNAASLSTMAWAPFGRAEIGWETYAPFVAHEIGTTCAPGHGGFAEALARWQQANGRPPNGIFGAQDFEVMRVVSHRRRPFVRAFANGCPPAADPASLVPARGQEGYAGKPISLRSDALAAYRRMVAAARREVPGFTDDPSLLTIFSGYRGPDEEAERCLGRDCDGPVRVACSPHRTGTAVDMFVGFAPGSRPDSTDDHNRLFMSKTPVYRWLVANASRFGFAPYVFEPWHWEWVAAPSP
jgi:hypothetical protein